MFFGLVHWPSMGGMSHLVRGEAWVSFVMLAQSPHRCTKCNSPPINGQCINLIRCGIITASALKRVKNVKITYAQNHVSHTAEVAGCTKCLKKLTNFAKLQFCQVWTDFDNFGKHTFKNYTRIQLFLSLHVCLLYLLLNSCDGNDPKHNAFSSLDCWWLWRKAGAPGKTGFITEDVRSDVLWPSRMHVTVFFNWSTASSMTFCDACMHMFSEVLLQVAGVASFPSQLFKSKQSK